MSDAIELGACHGHETRPTRSFMEHMEQCLVCDLQVRWDLVDHPFFGFKASCDHQDTAEAKR